MPTRLDALRESAESLAGTGDVQIATKPAVYGDGISNADHHIDEKALTDIVAFAASTHGVEADCLRAMALVLHKSLSGGEGGFVSSKPVQIEPDGPLHYPVIGIALSGTSRQANFFIRHEIKHVFQPNKELLYHRRWANPLIKAVGAIGVASSLAMLLPKNQPLIEAPLNPGLGLFLLTGSMMALCVLDGWILSAREWQANIFSWRHRRFKPFGDKIK